MNKQPLILLHGALANHRQFDALVPLLQEHYDVHRLDFSGHNGEHPEVDFSIEVFKRDLLDYIKQHQLRNLRIFGYSMGGYVALKAALEQPKRFKKILTLATKFDWTEESAAKEVLMLNPGKMEEKVPKYASYLKSMYGEEHWKTVVQQTGAMMMKLAQGDRLTAEDLASIGVPTVIGIGSADQMVSVQESTWAQEHLAESQLVVLPDVPHPLNKVDNRLLVELLNHLDWKGPTQSDEHQAH